MIEGLHAPLPKTILHLILALKMLNFRLFLVLICKYAFEVFMPLCLRKFGNLRLKDLILGPVLV